VGAEIVYKAFINNQIHATSDDINQITKLLEEYVKDCQDNGKQQQEFRVVKEG
jgi:hypothetical protein